VRRGWTIFTSTVHARRRKRGFRAHIAAARATGLPLVIHTRDADEDCGRILEDEIAKGSFKAVLHCYTGGRDLAMKAIALGLSISFTGILTFKKSETLRELAAELPADRIMVETDSPYLAPGKFRGKRNEPSYVVEVAKVLAETRGGVAGGNFATDIRKTSSACSPRCRARKPPHDADADSSGLRFLGRRSPSRPRLGRLRSQQSQKSPPPLFAAGRTDVGSGHHADRDRYLARPARAVDRRRGPTISMRYFSPTNMPTRPMASTTSDRWCCTSGVAFRFISISRPPKTSWRGFPTASSRPKAATIRRS